MFGGRRNRWAFLSILFTSFYDIKTLDKPYSYTIMILFKRSILAFIFLSFCTIPTLQGQTWESLFNGKNLKGWQLLNGKAKFEVLDGAIVGTTQLDTPNTFLATKKKFSDFILEMEFKADDRINSGIQFRSESRKEYRNGHVYGYQYEIDPSGKLWTGGIYDEERRGWLYPLSYNEQAQNAYRHNAWNKVRIEAYKHSIRTWINGIPCANIWDDATSEGFIALQIHDIYGNLEQLGLTISWRNIRICTQDVEQYLTCTTESASLRNMVRNTLTKQEKLEGWQLLWNGKSFTGWMNASADEAEHGDWLIEDGMLTHRESVDGSRSVLTSCKKYKDYLLSVDFKISEKSDGGILYLVPTDSKGVSIPSAGFQYQIIDDFNHPDAKAGIDGDRRVGSLYDLLPASKRKLFLIRDFNTVQIKVKGNHVEHWLNGIKVLEFERNTSTWNALVARSPFASCIEFGKDFEGYISLISQRGQIWFTNIKIKELD